MPKGAALESWESEEPLSLVQEERILGLPWSLLIVGARVDPDPALAGIWAEVVLPYPNRDQGQHHPLPSNPITPILMRQDRIQFRKVHQGKGAIQEVVLLKMVLTKVKLLVSTLKNPLIMEGEPAIMAYGQIHGKGFIGILRVKILAKL